MVDDLKPRYTTKRLRQEIERARENDARHIAALEAQLAEISSNATKARQAVERLANTKMDLSLSEWSELSSAILSALETTPPAPKVTEEWVRDTAMDVMLATEVEEAMRILRAALTAAQEAGKP